MSSGVKKSLSDPDPGPWSRSTFLELEGSLSSAIVSVVCNIAGILFFTFPCKRPVTRFWMLCDASISLRSFAVSATI